MDVATLSVVEIKALIYDEVVKLETAQANIRTLNDALSNRQATDLTLAAAPEVAAPAPSFPEQTETAIAADAKDPVVSDDAQAA